MRCPCQQQNFVLPDLTIMAGFTLAMNEHRMPDRSAHHRLTTDDRHRRHDLCVLRGAGGARAEKGARGLTEADGQSRHRVGAGRPSIRRRWATPGCVAPPYVMLAMSRAKWLLPMRPDVTVADFAPVAIGLALSAPLVLPMIGDAFGKALDVAGVAAVSAGDAGAVRPLGAHRFYKAGWHALKALTGNMDLLVAIGTTAGWALSMWLWLTAEPGEMVHLYFEGSPLSVVTLVLLGKWLEAAPNGAPPPRSALHALRPDVAHVISARPAPRGRPGGRVAHW